MYLCAFINSRLFLLHFILPTDRFLLGGFGISQEVFKQLRAENEKYGDIITLDDVANDYFSLTDRTITAFKHVIEHNYYFSYLLKCDDDSFVDILRIGTELHMRENHSPLFWGRFIKFEVKTKGKFRETKWSTCEDYVPYCYGGGYILSHDLVSLLARNEPYLKRYRSEDVSVGAWLAPYNIERLHDPKFNTGTSLRRACNRIFTIMHQVKQEEMYAYHKSLSSEGVLCGKEWISVYNYSWTNIQHKVTC